MSSVFLFPGQGSQSVGMMADLADHHPVVHEVFAEASDALGMDLLTLVLNGPEEQLNSTEFTQPALLVSSVATWLSRNACSSSVRVLAG